MATKAKKNSPMIRLENLLDCDKKSIKLLFSTNLTHNYLNT